MIVNNDVANLTDQYSRGDRNRDLLLALVNHLHTPKKILEQLTNSSDAEIAEAARLHINFAGEIGDRWYELAEKIIAPKDLGQNDLLICELLEFAVIPDYFINQWIPWTKITNNIENPHIPTLWRDRLLSRLADNSRVEARMWVAAYEHTPKNILKKLALDDDLRVRSIVSLQPNFSNEWLISNKVSTESILVSVNSLLSSLQYDYSQKNIKTKFAVLKLLCSNKDSALRLQAIDILIDDYSCPSDLLESLAKDRDVNIRNKVAGHIKTPIHVKEQLANDRSLMVRKTLASCSYTPKHILRRPASDNQDEVRNAVIFNDPFYRTEKPDRCINGILEKILENSWILSALNIEYDNLDDDSKQKILIKVTEDRTAKTQEYRTLLSEAKDTPNYILEKLVTSPEIRIRYYLAKRKDLRLDLSDKLWKELINDPNQNSISERSQEHLNCHYVRVNLSHQLEALPFICEKYYISSNHFAIFIILSHPLVPYFYIKKALFSISWLERYALTQNPKLPDEIRKVLRQDVNQIVRAAASYQDKIFAPSSGDIIPKLKTSDRNLVSTLNILTKELQGLINNPEHWEKRTNFEVILWENQRQFSFIDCLSELKILQRINIPDLLKSCKEQTIGKYVELPDKVPGEFKNFWIEPSISEQYIDRCQLLLKWLQTDLNFVEIYQVIFCKREKFQILIGQTQQGEWIGITVDLILENYWQPSRDAQNYNLEWFIKQLEILINDIDFSGELCDRNLLTTNDWRIDNNKDNLIKQLLVFADFSCKIDFNKSNHNYDKITNFFESFLTNIESYRMGKYSGYGWYCEDYTWGKTSEQNWLILKEIKSG